MSSHLRSRCDRTHRMIPLWKPRPLAWALACGLGMPAALAGAQGLPQAGVVARGQATITTQGNQMTVGTSADTVLNWQSFSVGAGQSVRFEQPSASSQVLNRVLGRDPSVIQGQLSSNGTVWLLNPYGVMFGKGARVDVGGLVASTLNLSDADWQARRYSLLDNGLASPLVNQGEIRTTLGGRVLLVGGSAGVRNEGLIEAPGGQVVLAAGASVDLADTHSPHVAVRVAAPAGQVVNLGQVLAASGTVDLAAAMVNQQGIVRADRLGTGPGGEVRLMAAGELELGAGSVTSADGDRGGRVVAQGGTTLVSGVVQADGLVGPGGEVKLLGQQVGLLDGSSVSASGQEGGGRILVGGGLQGKDPTVPNARAVYMAKGARARADAGSSGDGGQVILWSDEATRVYGTLSARGGSQGGDGGFIETSGGWLDARPREVRTDAPKGRPGQWLLDPNDISISDASVSDANISAGPDFTTTDDSATIDMSTIAAALAAGNNVTISTGTSGANSQPGDIVMEGDLDVDPPGSARLTLNAHRNITLSGAFITSGSALSVTLNAGTGGSGDILLSFSDIAVGGDVLLKGNGPAGSIVTSFSSIVAGGKLRMQAHAVELGPSVLVESSASGNAITISGTDGNLGSFFVDGDFFSLSAPSGRWLVYAGNPKDSANFDPGSISQDFTQYGATYPGTKVLGSGNGFLFSYQPVLEVTGTFAGPTKKIYDGTTSSAATFESNGVTGLVAGDALQGELTFEGVRYSSANAGTNISLVTSLKSSLPEVLDSFGRPVYGYKFGAVSTGITGDIMPRPLTVTGTASFDKVYDGTPDVVLTGLGLEGLVPGESLVLLAGTLAFADAGAAAGKAVSGVLELANGQNGRAANYVLAEGGVLATTATISPKPLTLLAGTVADKVYDGTTSAVIGAAGLQGLVGSETLTLVTTSGGFDTPDAGLAKAVDVSVALADGTGGGRAANYALSGGNTLSLRGNILPRPLELASLQVSDKVYDAKVDAQATSAGLSGLLPGQALNLSLQASFADSLAGAGKPVSVTAVLQDGAGGLAANYTLAGGAQRQSFASILPKEVVLRNMAVADKVYDGTREAVLQGGLLEGLLPGESLTLLPGTAVFDTADVGAGRPVVGVLALGDGAGGIAANYRLQDGSVSATASILPRPLNLSGAQVLDKTYDGTRSAVIVGGTLSGLVGSQTLSLETGSATFDTADAGVLKSVTLAVELGDGLNGGKASNYSLGDGSVLRLTGTIHPRPLNLTGVTVGDREYDGTNLAPASLGSLSGFVPGESVGARVDARFADRHVGDAKPVSIQIDLLDGPGGRASNYTLGAAAQQTTRASVLPRPVSVSGVSAVDKAYDGTTQATLRAGSFDGLVAGETLALAADARFDDKNVGSGKRVSGSVALADGNASASNYRLVNGGGFSGTASIVPRPLTLAGAQVADKIYDADLAATPTAYVLEGVVPGEQVSVSAGTGRFLDVNTGTGKPVTVTVTALSGADAPNYAIGGASTLATASISPAAAYFIADPVNVPVGYPIPVLSGTVGGLVGSDTLASATAGQLLFSTTAVQGSALGTYPVAGGGLSSRNYTLQQAAGNDTALRIVPVSTTVAGEPTSTRPGVEALRDTVLPVPVTTSVTTFRSFDAMPAVQYAPPSVVFGGVSLDQLSQPEVAGLLAARDRYKKSIFADAIRDLENNPGAADAPACQTVEQAMTGVCLVTDALKPAVRDRLAIDFRPALPLPVAPPVAAASPPPAPTTVAPVPPPPAPTVASVAPPPAPAPAVPVAPAAAVPVAPIGAAAASRVRPPAAVPAEPVFRLPAARAVRSAVFPQIQRKWALLIGTDVYADARIPQLDNAVRDIEAVARMLDGPLGYQTLVVRNGTKGAILRAFNQLASVVSPSDSVAIYYAGHGELVEKLGLGFWQPSDADATRADTWISNTDIGKLLGQISASQVVLVSDSCFSGSLVSEERIRGGAAPDPAALLSRRAAVVMSSGGNEPVADSGKNGHSAFAWSFMRALEGVANWRPGGNLFEQVRFAVARQVPQRPQYGASKLGGHQTGADYVFERRQLEASAN